MLAKVDPSLQNMGREEKEAWSDILGRSQMAKHLILDTKPGMLDQMVNSTYPGQEGPEPDFGDDVRALAKEL